MRLAAEVVEEHERARESDSKALGEKRDTETSGCQDIRGGPFR